MPNAFAAACIAVSVDPMRCRSLARIEYEIWVESESRKHAFLSKILDPGERPEELYDFENSLNDWEEMVREYEGLANDIVGDLIEIHVVASRA